MTVLFIIMFISLALFMIPLGVAAALAITLIIQDLLEEMRQKK